ncbi:MAG TPA: hypothetical protein VKA27_09995 [Sunxiuqinia sp.]|nr:hypothetical protein [Sunxiuqinia sp.]
MRLLSEMFGNLFLIVKNIETIASRFQLIVVNLDFVSNLIKTAVVDNFSRFISATDLLANRIPFLQESIELFSIGVQN